MGASGIIGIDVGGTRIKAGVVDGEGGIHGLRVTGVGKSDRTEAGMVALVKSVIDDLRSSAAVSAVGLGAPGVVDVGEGRIAASPNFPEWRDFQLVSMLKDAGVALPVYLDNDANVVGLGEGRFGAAKGAGSYVLLTLGTGVGGAIVLNGHVWRGEDGMAGELGHLNVIPDGYPCGCGSRGCLEQYASLNGMRHEVRERSLEIDDAESLLEDPDLPQKLQKMARGGHPAAIETFERMGYFLGLALGSLLNALNVKTVVLAGGIAYALPLFQQSMLTTISHCSFPSIHANLRVVQGTLGERAGVLGAAALAEEARTRSARAGTP